MGNDTESKIIKDIIYDIKNKCVIKNDAIKDDIFSILEQHCTVVYYPLKNEKNRGFHITRLVKDDTRDFVYINTDKPISEQIFAAAHEFGHIFGVADIVWKKLGHTDKITEDEEERITNLFAAELLMPEERFISALKMHVKETKVNPSSIKLGELVYIMFLLMNDFMVPYVAVRKRMLETKAVSEKDAAFLVKKEESILQLISILSKDKNTYLEKGTDVKTISGLRQLLDAVEQSGHGDEYLVCRIKKDFNIDDIPIHDEQLNISLGDIKNE